MGKGQIIFLKFTVYLIGVMIVSLCIFALPRLAAESAAMYPEYAYLEYPVLIGLYVTVIPFFFALYQALKLLGYVDKNESFSKVAVHRIGLIKYAAIIISLMYALGMLILFIVNALHPGIGLVGLLILFISVVIAVFTAVLQSLLSNALQIKRENDLTI